MKMCVVVEYLFWRFRKMMLNKIFQEYKIEIGVVVNKVKWRDIIKRLIMFLKN